jgi:hypothetical protein
MGGSGLRTGRNLAGKKGGGDREDKLLKAFTPEGGDAPLTTKQLERKAKQLAYRRKLAETIESLEESIKTHLHGRGKIEAETESFAIRLEENRPKTAETHLREKSLDFAILRGPPDEGGPLSPFSFLSKLKSSFRSAQSGFSSPFFESLIDEPCQNV